MNEFWHAVTVARFSWLDMGLLLLLMTLIDLGKAFVRGWRRSVTRDTRHQ